MVCKLFVRSVDYVPGRIACDQGTTPLYVEMSVRLSHCDSSQAESEQQFHIPHRQAKVHSDLETWVVLSDRIDLVEMGRD